MITLKTEEEISLMRAANQLVGRTLAEVAKHIAPGVSTLQLDKVAHDFICDNGATPAFLGYGGFPGSICTSINDHVVHGIPRADVLLQEGDIISVDCGALKNGYYGDHAYTFPVGEVSEEVAQLLRVTKESLYIGIREFKQGNRVEDVGYAIQSYCESYGYGVVRELVGHGVGTKMHEDPEMPNYGKRGRGKKFVEGMVVAIEPMINMGTKNINQLRDGWTILTRDGKPSAHFEHDVALIDGKPRLLSTFKYIYEALGIESNEEEEFLYK